MSSAQEKGAPDRAAPDDGAPDRGAAAPNGFWPRLKSFVLRQLSGITIISVAGLLTTLILAYFQNLSAYQDKVTTQAKDDMTAATQVFAEASTALSSATSLQQQMIDYFYAAVPNDAYKDAGAFPTASARAMYKDYLSAYTALHQNYNLLARKVEIYLDWPSDPTHNAATNTGPNVDPINMSTLGEFDFDCEIYMPDFTPDKVRVPLKDQHNGTLVYLDWRSAKHHVLTTQYCFDVTHKKLNGLLEWASQSGISQADWTYLTNKDTQELFQKIRPMNQTLRLNAFISLAMGHIEAIRARYQPKGYWCSVPVVQLFIGKKCTPVHLAS
jgi:hypothetical protein